jgi:phosphatidylserine/phosphatidylglycerophosphate/cardiolipin synthase-like enzyme
LGGGGISETVTGDWIVVHFTSPRYPDDASGHTGGIDADLVALIDSAEESVDVAAYDLDLETVVDALIRAQRDEVQVRLVTDVANAEQEAIARLREAQIPVVTRPGDGWAIMHNKFVVVDEVWVWTGSWNLTENGTYRNNNNAVLIASRSVAENYTAEFEEMYSGLFGPSSPADTPHPIVNIQGEETETRVEIYFSPEDQVIDHILRTLSEARSHVRFMAFQFTSEELADALVDLKEDGIEVEGVMEARYAGSSYSQYDRLRSGGVNVLGDSNPYIMHHKVFIVDDQTVILGSYNFTGSAEENNDENVLIVHDPEVAAAFLTEFDDIFQDGEAVQP